ncbi:MULTISPECIES: ZmpA/ZmpB/ZmpC family metallo-endopeptidase [Streptococcus]|uniref:ZmpA/ZmpB/ZmpC family metallo-endopeptidase n=1 Tax=Streptococcus sp. UMB0029 TaxID=2069308 RepID=UPI000C805BA5|nr:MULTISPECIES: ZmpA/ZmpB/ZmpC family metallo-endopeptidase [Streptococcus]MDK7321824.1 ZmpA/ZmpB/ZmpC family metallo-endopeptidase [Streptococcus mitis]PMC01548.1 peptidase M26 [Streptococcus sp. UMB0029]
MEKYFGEKQQRFSFRKLSVGLVSATISSLFFMSVLGSSSVEAQETKGVHYKYVTESELSSDEQNKLVYDIPTYVENDDETYYLVYKLNSPNQLGELPNTGSKNNMKTFVAGASLAALGILIFAVSKKKVKNKTVLHLVLVAGIGNGVLVSAHALENNLLLNYNTDYELTSGEKLPLPKDISGYTYIGYIKEGKTTSDSKVNNQEKSVASPTKQQKVDYSVTPTFVESPSTVQAIQEEKPVSTKLTNPTKEEKQSSNSQSQLAEHKDVQAGALITDKSTPEVQSALPEAVVSAKGEPAIQPALPEAVITDKGESAVQPELSKTVVTDKDKPAVQPALPEAVITNKGEPAIQPELSEAVVSDKGKSAVQPALPEAVVTNKGTPEVQPELPKSVVTDKDKPAVQPALPEAVVTDKGESEQVAPLPEYTGVQSGSIVEPEQVEPTREYTEVQAGALVEPEKVESPREYTGVQAGALVEPEKVEAPREYTGVQAGSLVEPEQVTPQPEYKGTQSSAIVEPETHASLPEYTGEQSGAAVAPETAEKPEYTSTQSGAIVEPEQVAPLPEYTGVQAGAIAEPEKVEAPREYTGIQAGALVEPEKVEAPREYTGVQAGALVEPEKVEPTREYSGSIEQPSTEETKPNNENTNTPEEMSIQKKSSALINMTFITDSSRGTGVGSATFIAPNVLLTVAHNFISSSSDNTTGKFIGDETKNTYEWVTPDGRKGRFTANDIHFYNKQDYPKGFIYDLAVIKLPETTGREHVELVKNYTKVNLNDKLNVHGYPAGKYTHLKDARVEMEQEYANNTYGVQYQGGKPGMSGGGIFNANGEVIGVHQNGAQNRSGGLILSPTQLAWIKSIIAGNEITPVYDKLYRHKDEKKDDVKEEDVNKKLELRNISSVELYSKEGDKYHHVTSLDSVPNDPQNYFMKVKSENFKDVMLPVTSITNDNKDNRAVYKIVASANNLIQHENNNVLENYTYYLPKTQQSETGVYTSFKNLVDAMNNTPNGTFRLGATMDARELELPDGQESYVKNEFHGTLIGQNNNKYYAIYNLKKPLFNVLNSATVKDISIKDVNISSKEDAATLAKEARNRTVISNVHADGAIAGEHGIGGLVSQVNNSTISNSSYTGRITNTYKTVASYQIGGLVGKLSGPSGLIDKSIASIDLASNATQGDQSIGGIVGAVEDSALISNSYAEGNLNNVQRFANVGGVVGNLWDPAGGLEKSGRLSNVLSDVNVTNGNAITGKDFTDMKAKHVYSNKNNRVVNVVAEDDEILTKDSTVQRGEVLEDAQIREKKAAFASKNTIKTEDFNFSSRYVTDYRNLENAVSSKEKVYKNIEKLLPFYNRETIVKYGNLVESSSNLYNKELLSVVPMKDNEVISDINKYKSSINKLLLYYADNTSEKLNVNYQSDFSNVAEYRIDGTNLIYTPNTLLHNYNNILDKVLPTLNSVEYKSKEIRKVLDVSNDVSLTELYLEEQFNTTKNNLRDSLTKLLTADAAIAENNNKIIDNYVIEKIKNNKEALLLGLTYLERWYNFKYGNTKAKDLVMYHLDFFGKSNSSALDNVIELGKSGYNNLLAKNNVITYNVLLAKNYKTNNLFDALEKYRKAFVPDKTNNEWFKEQTKAYIVEEKSTIKEVSDKQSIAGSPYSIGVYDRLTSPSWKYPSMVLPLLTLPEKSVFIIANISTIGFGAYDRYRSKDHPAGTNLNEYVETKAKEAAVRFRDHYDYWYKILDDKNKEKLYRSVLVYDAFRFGTDKSEDKVTYQATFETDHPAIKHFFGPAGNNVVHNSNGAYATGDAFYYMAYRMLDKDGAVTYTHEMTHNSDREIYLGGYGRRNGLGPEFYAKGLLQAPDHPDDPTITINSILKYEESEDLTRLQVKDPTKRFNNAEDLQKYMHNMFDVIYMLEYLEGNAVVNLDISKKNDLLRKIENKFETDPDGSKVYATNVIRYLNDSELSKLTTFNSLIENDVITRRGYENDNDNTFKRNGYYTIKLFSPIYSALSNDKGTPGDLMGRRMAFELLAAKGFKDGMVPYISNQYAEEAKANGDVITSYGKKIGNVTDKLVLEKVFNNRYSSWIEFKKAMYNERIAKFNKLMSISFINPNGDWFRKDRVTITNINALQRMMTTAVNEDAEDYLVNIYPERSRVHKLKQAIYKAYLDQTNDFRNSIFENKK